MSRGLCALLKWLRVPAATDQLGTPSPAPFPRIPPPRLSPAENLEGRITAELNRVRQYERAYGLQKDQVFKFWRPTKEAPAGHNIDALLERVKRKAETQ